MVHRKLTYSAELFKSPAGRVAFAVPEVATAVGVSPGLIREEIARGRLQARRIGKRLVILPEDLDTYLSRSTPVRAR